MCIRDSIYSSAYKAGTGAKVAVDTTEVKNIWKANGAKLGMVLYEVYTTCLLYTSHRVLAAGHRHRRSAPAGRGRTGYKIIKKG